MKTFSFSWIKKLVAGSMLALMMAAPVVQAQSTTPDIYYSYTSPGAFNPSNNETIDIFWYSNTLEASVKIDIYDGNPSGSGQVVWSLLGETAVAAAPNPAVFDGKIGTQPYPDGTYYYKVTLENDLNQSDEWVGNFEIVSDNNGGGGNDPQITGVSVSDDPFDPTNGETTTLTFTTDQCAFLLVEVEDSNNNTVATLDNDQGSCTPAGTHTYVWDGEDQFNDDVAEGIYDFEITATNNDGSDFATTDVEVDYDNGGNNGTAPEILELYADPDEFDPMDGEETDIFFRLDEDARVTLQILDGNTVIRTLVNNANADSGLSFVEWDGEDNGNDIVDEGFYAIRLTACDLVDTNECDIAFATVEVTEDGGTGNNGDMRITNDFADPNPFDPDEENTRIYYTINMDGDVTIEIFDEDDDLVRTILDDVNRNEGANSSSWNGEDRFGDELPDGDYTYEITACDENDSSDCDTETGTVVIDRDGSYNNYGDLIDDVHVNNPIFDPTENEESEICFDVLEDNVEITIQVLDGNTVVDTIVYQRELDEENNRCYDWDGEEDNGNLLDDGVYQFRIRAEKGSDVEVAFAYTELDTDGIIIGFPNDNTCGGFWDVPADSPFCEAIRLMSYRGIFDGYPDGSFQPYAPINRAETVKVVLLALDYNILSDDGSTLGYWDVIRGAWYMRYLRTAQREGVATGYPDGSFRPGSHINRVELLRVFLEASDITIPHCNVQPYPDTPIQLDTRWYMDYVCFAKAYGLMGTDANGNFNPAQPMTRGDVAMLFYNFEVRGLFGGYNQLYYNDYWNNFQPGYYVSPGYGYNYMYNGYYPTYN